MLIPCFEKVSYIKFRCNRLAVTLIQEGTVKFILYAFDQLYKLLIIACYHLGNP